MSAKHKRKIQKQLEALKDFPNTKRVKALRKELQDKLKRIESGVRKDKQTKLKVSKKEIQQQANLTRSAKLRKYHHYLRQIVQNYPNLSYKQIRQQYKQRKLGKDVDTPDVIWRNPSP